MPDLQDTWTRHGVYALAVIAAAVLIGFMLINAIFSVWLERKVAGRIDRKSVV